MMLLQPKPKSDVNTAKYICQTCKKQIPPKQHTKQLTSPMDIRFVLIIKAFTF